MGKATVVSGGTDGKYEVKLDFGKAAQTAAVAKLTARLAELVTKITEAQTKIDTELVNEVALKAKVENAIEAYALGTRGANVAAATVKDLLKTYTEAMEALAAHARKMAPLRLAMQFLKDEKAQAIKDKAYWEGLVLEETREAWCADLTETATGAVATIEIPGESALVLIAPEGPAPVAADGVLSAREVMSAGQAYFNAAILPGWQKFRPTYRRGVITALYTADDTADLTLTNDTSSAQKLKINQADDLKKVPIEYMTCNSGAFTVGDRCVVKFIDQDFSMPKVVGFVDNPKACGYVLSGVIKNGEIISVPVPPNSAPGTLPTSTLRSYKPTAQAYQYMLKSDPVKSTTTFSDEIKLGRQGNQFANICPSMYSGLMAKAVQVIMGQGLEVKYDYHWSKCHGITLDSDGKPWLIEISVSNGVIAMRLPVTPGSATSAIDVIRESVSLFKGIPTGASFPSGAALVAALSAGTVIRLATSAAMAGYFANTPYVENMGWSFNDTGTEAHNTCHRVGVFDPAEKYGCHYRVDLSILLAGGIASGSASLSLVSEGLFTVPVLLDGAVPFSFMSEFAGAVWPPMQQVDYPPTHSTPIFVCHINGVLDIVTIETTEYMGTHSVYSNIDGLFAPHSDYTALTKIGGVEVIAKGTRAKTNGLRNTEGVIKVVDRLTFPQEYWTEYQGVWTLQSTDYGVFVLLEAVIDYPSFDSILSWPGTARDCYCYTHGKDRAPRTKSHTGRYYDQSQYDANPVNFTTLSLNFSPTTPLPPEYSGTLEDAGLYSFISYPTLILTAPTTANPSTSVNFQTTLVIPNEYTPIWAKAEAYLPDGSAFAREDTADLTPFLDLSRPTVRASVFGSAPHATLTIPGSGDIRTVIGGMLTTEVSPGDATNYNFIGYL